MCPNSSFKWSLVYIILNNDHASLKQAAVCNGCCDEVQPDRIPIIVCDLQCDDIQWLLWAVKISSVWATMKLFCCVTSVRPGCKCVSLTTLLIVTIQWKYLILRYLMRRSDCVIGSKCSDRGGSGGLCSWRCDCRPLCREEFPSCSGWRKYHCIAVWLMLLPLCCHCSAWAAACWRLLCYVHYWAGYLWYMMTIWYDLEGWPRAIGMYYSDPFCDQTLCPFVSVCVSVIDTLSEQASTGSLWYIWPAVCVLCVHWWWLMKYCQPLRAGWIVLLENIKWLLIEYCVCYWKEPLF